MSVSVYFAKIYRSARSLPRRHSRSGIEKWYLWRAAGGGRRVAANAAPRGSGIKRRREREARSGALPHSVLPTAFCRVATCRRRGKRARSEKKKRKSPKQGRNFTRRKRQNAKRHTREAKRAAAHPATTSNTHGILYNFFTHYLGRWSGSGREHHTKAEA